MLEAVGWTDERIKLLKQLVEQGLSSSLIARELGGGLSRNAVIGKVHRLGLAGRAPKVRQAVRGRNNNRIKLRKIRAPKLVEVAPRAEPLPPEPAPPPDTSCAVSLLELTSTTCRWPLGDPRDPEFKFCGALCSAEETYCGYHAGIAYVPANRRVPTYSIAERERRARQARANFAKAFG